MTVRCDAETIRRLNELAKAGGWVDRSAFVREFLESAVGDDFERLSAFHGRLFARLLERAQMRLPGIEDGPKAVPNRPTKGGRPRAG